MHRGRRRDLSCDTKNGWSFLGGHLLLNKAGLVDLAPSVVAGMKGKSAVLCNVVLLDTYIDSIYLCNRSKQTQHWR